MHDVRVAPSILSADFARLGAQVEEVMDAGARVIHVDVMDGHFVPPISIGALIVEALRDRGGFNFLAPASGSRFIARGRVTKPGCTLTVCAGDEAVHGARVVDHVHFPRLVLAEGRDEQRLLGGRADQVGVLHELPALGAVSAPAAVLIRPDGYVAWVGDLTQLGLADALTTWFGPPAA